MFVISYVIILDVIVRFSFHFIFIIRRDHMGKTYCLLLADILIFHTCIHILSLHTCMEPVGQEEMGKNKNSGTGRQPGDH
jgi:hypothetical protein